MGMHEKLITSNNLSMEINVIFNLLSVVGNGETCIQQNLPYHGDCYLLSNWKNFVDALQQQNVLI